jgi:hypothetical protein
LNELSNLQELVQAELARRAAQAAKPIEIRRVVVAPCWDSGGHRLPNRVCAVYRHAEDGSLVAEDVPAEELERLNAEANRGYHAAYDDEKPDIEDRDAIADTAVSRAAERIAKLRGRP